VNLGIRYEYYSVFKVEEKTLLNAGTPENVYAVPIKWRPSDSIYNGDFNNFLPRVGVAWSPGGNGKTTVRGGFGMGVAQLDLRHNYTWSKVLALNEGDFSGSGDNLVQDESNMLVDYGPISSDRTHVFVSNFAYTIPLESRLSAKGALKEVLGGWGLGGISVTGRSTSTGHDPDYHRFHRVKGGFLAVQLKEGKPHFRLHDVDGAVGYAWAAP
jgi:hypothetical protein